MSVTSRCQSVGLSVNFCFVGEFLSVGQLSVGEWLCFDLYCNDSGQTGWANTVDPDQTALE